MRIISNHPRLYTNHFLTGINQTNAKLSSRLLLIATLLSAILVSLFIGWGSLFPFSLLAGNSAQSLTANAQSITNHKKRDDLINTSHRIFAPHWSNEDGATTIYIRNIDIRQGVFARLSLILNHRTLALPETYIDSLQTISIDLKQALMQNGERLDQSGAAFLDFESESDSALVAYAQVVNPDKGLSFNFPFLSGTTPAMPGGPTHPGPLEAVAWYLNKNTDAFIALQNTTDKPAIATPTMFVSERAVSLGQRHLKPREAITIKLPSPYGLGDEESQRSAMVRVEYKGEAGAVEAEGWVVNDEVGFSAAFTFHRKVSDCQCPDGIRHLYGTGIAIGKGAMMGMAPEATFSPYLAVGNRSRAAIAINPVLSYQRGDEHEKILLPRIFLEPQESALVNLQEYQESGIIPSTVNDASIDLQYQGEAGALIAELASLDQDGSFVSPVPMTCNGQRLGEMAFWRTDGDWHSSLSVWNVAAEPMELEIRISHPGGEYEIEREIGPGATAMVSVNELQQSQEPDGEGRTIPAGVTMGGMSIRSRNQVNGLVMNAMLVNPVAKTCAECGSYGYVRYCVLTDDPGSTATHKSTIYRGVGENFPMYIVITYSTGFPEIVEAVIVGNTNPSVASGQTQVTTISPGTTTLTGRTFNEYPLDRFCTVYDELETSGDLQVIQLKIKQDGADVTGLTSAAIVGQKISLVVEVLPAGTQMSNKQWTVPGPSSSRVANYVVNFTDQNSPTSATVTPLTNTTDSSITFYWVSEAFNTVVFFSCQINGVPFIAHTTFDFKRPAVLVSVQTGEVEISTTWRNSLAVHFGRPNLMGIACTRTLFQVPSGFSGNTFWVQTANIISRRLLSDGTTWQRLTGAGLDTDYPSSGGIDQFFADAPAQFITSTNLQYIVNWSFETWLMFKPHLQDSIPVPLLKTNWAWSAHIQNQGGNWVFLSKNNTEDPPFEPTTTFPVWNTNAIQHSGFINE